MLPTQPFDRPSVLWAFESYRRYCWTVHSLADLKLAPFHLLASEGKIHTDKDHVWHMTMAGRLCAADPDLLLATPYKVVELGEESSQKQGIAWWEELTAAGGEGIVVKPLEFVTKGRRGVIQPAVKCRGREYLRVIYGPEYTAPEHLERLRARFGDKAFIGVAGICSRPRSIAKIRGSGASPPGS